MKPRLVIVAFLAILATVFAQDENSEDVFAMSDGEPFAMVNDGTEAFDTQQQAANDEASERVTDITVGHEPLDTTTAKNHNQTNMSPTEIPLASIHVIPSDSEAKTDPQAGVTAVTEEESDPFETTAEMSAHTETEATTVPEEKDGSSSTGMNVVEETSVPLEPSFEHRVLKEKEEEFSNTKRVPVSTATSKGTTKESVEITHLGSIAANTESTKTTAAEEKTTEETVEPFVVHVGDNTDAQPFEQGNLDSLFELEPTKQSNQGASSEAPEFPIFMLPGTINADEDQKLSTIPENTTTEEETLATETEVATTTPEPTEAVEVEETETFPELEITTTTTERATPSTTRATTSALVEETMPPQTIPTEAEETQFVEPVKVVTQPSTTVPAETSPTENGDDLGVAKVEPSSVSMSTVRTVPTSEEPKLDPAPVVTVKTPFTLRLPGIDYTPAFADKTSGVFRKLSDQVIPPASELFAGLLADEFVRLDVASFQQGIVVNGILHTKHAVLDPEELANKVERAISVGGSVLGANEVDSRSITVNGAPSKAYLDRVQSSAPTSAASTLVIGSVIAVGVLVVIIVALTVIAMNNRRSNGTMKLKDDESRAEMGKPYTNAHAVNLMSYGGGMAIPAPRRPSSPPSMVMLGASQMFSQPPPNSYHF